MKTRKIPTDWPFADAPDPVESLYEIVEIRAEDIRAPSERFQKFFEESASMQADGKFRSLEEFMAQLRADFATKSPAKSPGAKAAKA